MSLQPDCCQHPTLRLLRVVDEITAGQIVLKQCDVCQTYWLAIQGCLELADGNVELESLERLSDEEANDLQMEPAAL